ncbi:MAG: threonylcarbamoyl-AMP synthase [Epulopiscium sp.]|nr:threonylcarbamoyl-AMP synthase [Candidatus Epulonipiscium sp.]
MIETIVKKIDKQCIDKNVIQQAGDILASGGIVAFPTETVYGLGANALDSKAIQKIFQAKGRPSDNPLIVHISKQEDLFPLVSEVPTVAIPLMKHFWPGPLTLIFPKSSLIPKEITGGLSTVGIRYPIHPIARAIIQAAKVPIAAPSANLSGKPSPTKAEHVIHDLDGRVNMIVDGGNSIVGLESTVLDITGKTPMILRPGGITKDMLESVIGPVLLDPTLDDGREIKKGTVPKAPGMKYKHYAPKAQIEIMVGEIETVVKNIQKRIQENKNHKKIGIMATDQTKNKYKDSDIVVISVGDRNKPETIASHLFDVLRQFDDMDMDIIYAEGIPEVQMGMAIMNRLVKASGYHVNHV